MTINLFYFLALVFPMLSFLLIYLFVKPNSKGKRAKFSDYNKLFYYDFPIIEPVLKKDNKLKIVSDGHVMGTQVFLGALKIPNVTSIEINPLTIKGGLVEARITCVDVSLDIEAKAGEFIKVIQGEQTFEKDLKELLQVAKRFRQTPIVDDDFPEVRHEHDSLLNKLLYKYEKESKKESDEVVIKD